MTTKNPFLSYTQAIAEAYTSTSEGLLKTNERPKKRSYKQIHNLLQESFFLGATKFGDNFIA